MNDINQFLRIGEEPVTREGHSPGPWQMATSCSFRRVIDANGREIIGGTVQRSDGHPDLHFTNGGYEGPDTRLVLAAPQLLEALQYVLANSGERTVRDTANAAINAARGV